MADSQNTRATVSTTSPEIQHDAQPSTDAPAVQAETTPQATGSSQPTSYVEKVHPYQDVQQPDNAGSTSLHQPNIVTPLNCLDETEAWVDCPFCHRRTKTRMVQSDSSTTILAGVLCCIICICLACLPCLAGWCQNTTHFCSQCNNKLTYKPHDGNVSVMQPQPGTVPSKYANPQQHNQPPQQSHSVQSNNSPPVQQPPAYANATQ